MQTATEKKHTNSKARQASAAHVTNGIHTLRKDVDAATTHIKDDLGNLAYHAGIQARQFVDRTEENVAGMADSVAAKISENPLQSGAIMLGAGVLLGAFLFRR